MRSPPPLAATGPALPPARTCNNYKRREPPYPPRSAVGVLTLRRLFLTVLVRRLHVDVRDRHGALLGGDVDVRHGHLGLLAGDLDVSGVDVVLRHLATLDLDLRHLTFLGL